ncbi:MAG: hypothetical protein ACP5HM_10660 [Anaerolineae bacterium]
MQTQEIINMMSEPVLADGEMLTRRHTGLYKAVERKANLPPQDKADVQTELQEPESKFQKDPEADGGCLRRRLHNIRRIAPDICAERMKAEGR